MLTKSMPFAVVALLLLAAASNAEDKEQGIRLSIEPPHISTDKSVRYDYDIVYVRGLRRTDGKEARWAEFSRPTDDGAGRRPDAAAPRRQRGSAGRAARTAR